MFKQTTFAAAAIALTLAAGAALAQTAERNVFDTETYQRMPAAVSVSPRRSGCSRRGRAASSSGIPGCS